MAETTNCEYCQKGDAPALLDEDGVKVERTGKPGKWCHAYDVYYWTCPRKHPEDYRTGKYVSSDWPMTELTIQQGV